ncbi:MAG: MarC family protein [Planctomycetota bacterium]|nr:MarC family protein [Planctomycetota bacterium]
MESWLNAFLALFAIVDPLGSLPLATSMTSHIDAPARRRVFNIATCTAFLTLVFLTLCGQWVMQKVFSIHFAEFMIAGGILLTVHAVRNIAMPESDAGHSKSTDVLELAIVPLAIPLLMGPGALVTAILILDRDGWVVALTCITAVFALTWLILRVSDFLNRVMGRLVTLALSRIMNVFIAAIGVHFLTSGIRELFLKP